MLNDLTRKSGNREYKEAVRINSVKSSLNIFLYVYPCMQIHFLSNYLFLRLKSCSNISCRRQTCNFEQSINNNVFKGGFTLNISDLKMFIKVCFNFNFFSLRTRTVCVSRSVRLPTRVFIKSKDKNNKMAAN